MTRLADRSKVALASSRKPAVLPGVIKLEPCVSVKVIRSRIYRDYAAAKRFVDSLPDPFQLQPENGPIMALPCILKRIGNVICPKMNRSRTLFRAADFL